MSRLFDGTDDVMTYGAAAPGAGSSAHTLLVVAKNVSGTSWASLVEREASGGSLVHGIGRRSNGNLYYAPTGGIQDGGASFVITATTTWWVLAVTHPGGTAVPRFHKVNVGGGSPTHANGSSTTPGGTAARVKIGGDDDFANFLIAAAAVWQGTALADADIEGIATAATTQSIADLSPTWLVDDSDSFATDLIGTADRTAITGTTDSADDPPSWVYGLGGGPITVDLTPATETDSAQALSVTHTHFRTLTPATETSAGQALDVDKTVTVSPAAETDTGQPLDVDKQVTLTAAASTETAVALSVTKTIFKDLVAATETDAAQALSVTHTHFVTLTPAGETDAAVDLTFTQPGGPIDITPAVETDTAVALTWTKTIFVTVTPASETGAAQALDTDKTVTITPASESCSATALSVTHVHYRTLSPAAETSEAVALSYVAGFLPSATISITLTDRPTRVTVRDQTAAQVQDRAHLVLREHA